MEDYIKTQEDNRIKALNAFNDLLDCAIKADSRYSDIIGKDFIQLMAAKANVDEEGNKKIGWIRDGITRIGKGN